MKNLLEDKMKLYELADQFKTLTDVLDSDFADDQEASLALRDALDATEGAFADKLEAIAKIIKNQQGDVEALKAEEQRLSAKRKSIESKIDSLKLYAEMQMEYSGLDKLKTPLFNFNVQNNPPSVDVFNPDILPKKYLVIQEPKIDKRGILDAIKAGEEVPGASIMQSRGLRIR
jgi:hypothetical protein